jgi:hypothetical protein
MYLSICRFSHPGPNSPPSPNIESPMIRTITQRRGWASRTTNHPSRSARRSGTTVQRTPGRRRGRCRRSASCVPSGEPLRASGPRVAPLSMPFLPVVILYPHCSGGKGQGPSRSGSRTLDDRLSFASTLLPRGGIDRAAIDSVCDSLRSCVADSVSRYGYRARDNRSAREGRPRRGDRGDVRPRCPRMAHRDGIPRHSIWLDPAEPDRQFRAIGARLPRRNDGVARPRTSPRTVKANEHRHRTRP